MRSFVSGRIQYVKLNENSSSRRRVMSGAPQDSVLGPLIYAIYRSCFIRDLQYCDYHLYSDDTQLYYSFPKSKTEVYCSRLSNVFDRLAKIIENRLFKLNPYKSYAVLFCNDSDRDLFVNGLTLRRVAKVLSLVILVKFGADN